MKKKKKKKKKKKLTLNFKKLRFQILKKRYKRQYFF